MASDQKFVDFVTGQIHKAGNITAKKMFGEYGIYSDGIIFGMVCDNRLYIKPTDAGKKFAPSISLSPPYPGGKDYLLVEDQIDDKDWLSKLIRITLKALPPPGAKKKKSG